MLVELYMKNINLKKVIYPKIIISSGGSGGHIYTGISIADEIKKQIPNSSILFIGSEKRMEINEIPKFGYPIKKIIISGGRNKFNSIFSISSLLMEIIHSFFSVNKIIKNFSPDIVIGTGGFVSFPTLCMAKKNGVPILLQEQNSFPGLTNRIFSRYAKKICVAYEQTKKFFPKKKTILTGNPVRSGIFNLPKKETACSHLNLKRNKPIILSLGGSQGSNKINKFWINKIKKIIRLDIQLIWQIGNFDIKEITKKNKVLFNHPNILALKFIEDIFTCYAAADLVVSRAGALTISEICLIGKPYILIPFSNSSDDHQNKNARILEDKKAALIIKDEEIENKLMNSIIKLLDNNKLRKKMIKNILLLGKPKAVNNIVKEILQII